MSEVFKVKTLVLVLAVSMLITATGEKALEYISSIYYLIRFKKNINKTQVQALIDSKSEVNTIYLSFAKQLGLLIRPINVEAQKIDSTMLDIHGIIVAAFSIMDKVNQVRFFEKTFLMVKASSEIVFGIPFLTLSSVDVDFLGWELR